MLKARGFDLIKFHDDGFAPLHRACWGKEKRHTEVVKFLVEEVGVDPGLPTKPSKDGTSPGGSTCIAMTQNPDTKAFLSTKSEL